MDGQDLIEETLDPKDWAAAEALSHQIVGDAVGYLRDLRERRPWQAMPASVRETFPSRCRMGPPSLPKSVAR